MRRRSHAATGNEKSMLPAAECRGSEGGCDDCSGGRPHRLLAARRDEPGGSGHHHHRRADRLGSGRRVRRSVMIKATPGAEIRRARRRAPSASRPRARRFAVRRDDRFVAELRGRLAGVVVVPCGMYVTAKDVTTTARPDVGCSGITGTIKKVSDSGTAGGERGNRRRQWAQPPTNSPAAPTTPAMPSAPAGGTSITFGDHPTSFSGGRLFGVVSGSTWTVSRPAGGTYNFQARTAPGGLSVQLTTTGSGSTTNNISGAVTSSGSNRSFGSGPSRSPEGRRPTAGRRRARLGHVLHLWSRHEQRFELTFGSGTFNLAGGLVTGGGSTTTFGVGRSTSVACRVRPRRAPTTRFCHTDRASRSAARARSS